MFGLISIKDFAKKLEKPESTVRTWKRGDLPAFIFINIGGTVFIKIKKFEEWVENVS